MSEKTSTYDLARHTHTEYEIAVRESATGRRIIAHCEEREDAETIVDALQGRAEKDRQIAALTAERDLAIAHDRQPYPTADGYDKVCHAFEKYRNFWDGLKEWLAQEDARIDKHGDGSADGVVYQTAIRTVLRHMMESERIYPVAIPSQPPAEGKD